MSGVEAAGLALGVISSVIQIINAARDIYNAANDASGLPQAFHAVAVKLPTILILLKEAEEYTKSPSADLGTCDAFRKILGPSKKRAQELHEIFTRVIPKESSSRRERYVLAVRTLGKGARVESLVGEILKDLNLLAAYFSFPESTKRAIASAWEEVKLMEYSLVDGFDTESARVNLRELKYDSTQSYPESGSIDERKAFFRSWLVPEVMTATNSIVDQTSYLAKRFQDPASRYTACDWFFDTDEYQNFLNSGGSVLRINGSPGSGKSILSSAVIDRLQAEEASQVLYFYGHQAPEPSTSLQLVRVLLEQTLQWENLEVFAKFDEVYLKQPLIEKTEEELWTLLRAVLVDESKRVFIVVDALDEFAHQHIVARNLIRIITKLATTSKPCLLVSSRLEGRDAFDNKSIRNSLAKSIVQSSQLEITQERTFQDLTRLVSHRVHSSPEFEFKSVEIKNRVISGVCERAGGMFLWANLVLDDMKDDRISSPSAIDITLSRLPKGLFDIYKQNLERSRRSIKGPEVFAWIFCSNSALTWQELRSALAIGATGYDEMELVDDTCEVFINHSCGPLIESYGPSEYLRFIHPTVRDFLVDRLGSDGPGVELGIAKAHSLVARKLLTFLNYSDLPRFSSKDDTFLEATLKAYSLQPGRGIYSFATFNWYKHLRECDKFEDSDLEKEVLRFLTSSSLVRWLKSAIILSHSAGRGDSVSITVDVIDSLQSWIHGRQWSDSQYSSKVQDWIKDFLGLMLDWGTVLDNQPDWLHYLHHDLLPQHNSFREILEMESHQAVIRFHDRQVLTKSSEPATWPDRSLVVDLERDLAFTFDGPFLSCYHMQTGLLTAEILIPVPSSVNGPLVARKGALSGDGKYLAVTFEAVGPLSDPVGAQMRSGQKLTLDDTSFKLAWTLEKSRGLDASAMLAHMVLGIENVVFVICLLELQHEGPSRTNLFALPDWNTSPVLGIGTQTIRWELDDVDALNFSSDSLRLATPFGVYELGSGKKTRPWPFALSILYHGGKITNDFETFATVSSSFDNKSILQLYDVHDRPSDQVARQTFDIPGAAHVLAISTHGSFILLLRIQISEKKTVKSGLVRSEQASIGIWDCHKQSEQKWTPILTLDPACTNKRRSWDFAADRFPPCFGPEAEKDTEVNKVLIYAPPGWKLLKNVTPRSKWDVRRGYLLVVGAKRSISSGKNFGKSLVLDFELPMTSVRTLKTLSPLCPPILSWAADFKVAFVYEKMVVKPITTAQLKDLALVGDEDQNVLPRRTTDIPAGGVDQRSVFLISPDQSEAFYIRLSRSLANDTCQTSIKNDSQTLPSADQRYVYDISVSCLRERESLPVLSSARHMSSPKIYYPSLDSLYASVNGDFSLTVGSLELDLCHTYDEMEIEVRDLENSIFQRVMRSFASRYQLLGRKHQLELVKWNETSPNTGYAIFEGRLDPSFENISPPFSVSGSSTPQDDIHIFQFSRPYQKEPGETNHQEARQFEVFICVFDASQDKITWLMHTTTGGDIAQSLIAVPHTTWALHPHLPLLVWQLPGHRVRVSNLESHEPPLTIAESLTLEADSTNAIKFSPDGRYVAIQGHETFKNDFMNFRTSQNLWSIVICDLVEGKSIEATLKSDATLSFNLENEILRTYRLKRGGAIESTLYTLPKLELIERQYLTYLPANCSCSSCRTPFEPHCNISVLDCDGEKSVVLCHSPVNIGWSRLDAQACAPLILRIANPPVQLKLDSQSEGENSLQITGRVEFPNILSEQGEILDKAFDNSRHRCDKEAKDCSCTICKATKIHSGDVLEARGVLQLRATISDFKLTTGDKLLVAWENIDHTMQEILEKWASKLCIRKEAEAEARNAFSYYKAILGEECFPWDNWAEYREAMDENKDEFDYDGYMKKMFEPGKCGVGGNTPTPINTFLFQESVESESVDFRWTSAMAVIWIEEDLRWFYDRLFGGDFEGARKWYAFPAYQALDARAQILKADKTEKGARFRKVWDGKPDLDTRTLESTFEQRLEWALPEREGAKESDSDMQKGNSRGGLLFPIKLKEVFDTMSDVIPGFGIFFEKRMHIMLNQSMIGELIE